MINSHREAWLAITLPTDSAGFDAPFIKAIHHAIRKSSEERVARADIHKTRTAIPRVHGPARHGLHFKLIWEGDLASLTEITALPGETVWINLLRKGLTLRSPFKHLDDEGYEWANTVEPGVDQKAIEAVHRYGHEMNAKDIQDLRERVEKLEHLHTQTEAVLDMQRQHLHDLTHRDFNSELVKHLRQIADALDQTGGE